MCQSCRGKNGSLGEYLSEEKNVFNGDENSSCPILAVEIFYGFQCKKKKKEGSKWSKLFFFSFLKRFLHSFLLFPLSTLTACTSGWSTHKNNGSSVSLYLFSLSAAHYTFFPLALLLSFFFATLPPFPIPFRLECCLIICISEVIYEAF